MALDAHDPHARPLPLAVFQLRGDQRAMGEQHGRLQRELGGHAETLAYYPRMAESLLRGSQARPFDRLLPAMLRPAFDVMLRRLEQSRPADFLARSRAYYRALGQDPAQSRHLLAMDLFQNTVGLAGRHGAGTFVEPWAQRALAACSTLAAWGAATRDGRLLHGRNFDFPGAGIWDAAPSIVFCSPAAGVRYGFVASRGADTPGVTCFNEAGLVLTMHTRLHQDVAFTGTAAVDLGHAVISRARTLAEAVTLLLAQRSASTWGIVISSASERKAVLVEISAQGTVVSQAPAAEPFLACTNHFQAPALQAGELFPCAGWMPYSAGRLQRLQSVARQAHGGEGLEAAQLQALLGDSRDPEYPDIERVAGGVLAQAIGVQSIVADPERGGIHVSVGRAPTGRDAYQWVEWDWSAPVGVTVLPAARPTLPAGTSRFQSGLAAEAYHLYRRAAQLEAAGGSLPAITAALERAAQLDPAESTLQLLAGACAMRRGAWRTAQARFLQGLQGEPHPFHRGRLLLWAARAARAGGDADAAARHRAELANLGHPWLGPIHEASANDRWWPPSCDALRHLPMHVGLGDIG